MESLHKNKNKHDDDGDQGRRGEQPEQTQKMDVTEEVPRAKRGRLSGPASARKKREAASQEDQSASSNPSAAAEEEADQSDRESISSRTSRTSGGSVAGAKRKATSRNPDVAYKGRGRPPTTGEYCGINDARRERAEIRQKELDIRVQENILDEIGEVKLTEVEQTPTRDLGARITDLVEGVETIRKKCGKLQGPLSGQMRKMLVSIKETGRTLTIRAGKADRMAGASELEEGQTREVALLRDEIQRLRRELDEVRMRPPPAPRPLEQVQTPRGETSGGRTRSESARESRTGSQQPDSPR